MSPPSSPAAPVDTALTDLVDEMQQLLLDTSHGGSTDDLRERIGDLTAAVEELRDHLTPGGTYHGWASLTLEEPRWVREGGLEDPGADGSPGS